jgi:hypothetical protein
VVYPVEDDKDSETQPENAGREDEIQVHQDQVLECVLHHQAQDFEAYS